MNIRDLLTDAELSAVTERSDWRAARIVLFDWTVIVGTFYLMASYPNPITILLGLFLLGARQLGLGVIVHETGHRTLFSSNKLNDFVGNWLSGYWVFSHKDAYMRGHLKHHQEAGKETDPDLGNYKSFPVAHSSLKRKFIRDLTGQVGWRRIKSIYRGLKNIRQLDAEARTYLLRSVGANAGMLLVLTAFGHSWLFLVWVAAFMTTHMMIVRIRQIAEHAGVPNHFDTDPRLNTRTLYINPLERLFIAPHRVNYHLEHHMLASVPIYRLEKLHRILMNKGYYDDVTFQRGYLDLLRTVTVPG
ncbi:MAG: fatty acid desaturase [Candidatus Azotimanducaceae bacterium]|jgi:fatty acid desaturase